MKINYFFIQIICLLFIAKSSNAQNMDTIGLTDLVNKVCEFIEKNDYEGLKNIIVEKESFTKDIFENMKIVHAERNYQKMHSSSYKASEREKNIYILGGHNYGHIHIEFHKVKGQWVLQKTWECR